MLYEMKGITRDYVGRRVLDLDLSLGKGMVTGVLGPNGAGKTTLLEILSFLSRPTSGELFYEGARVDFDQADLISLRRKAVLVQQKPILFTATVFNNVEFPLKIRHLKKGEREKTVKFLLSMVGMEGFWGARAHKLSGGETQRVAIAQALACSPEVILMDEPTASVDVENRIIIERIIRDINRMKGISVIFTTHDRIQASRIADDIVFMHEGKVTESIHENIFGGVTEAGTRGEMFCVLRDGLKIPVRTKKSGQIRISIKPDSIALFRLPGDEEMFRIRGRVIQLSDEKDLVRAIVDIGVPLTIAISVRNARGLIPAIGEDVWVYLDPKEIDVF